MTAGSKDWYDLYDTLQYVSLKEEYISIVKAQEVEERSRCSHEHGKSSRFLVSVDPVRHAW